MSELRMITAEELKIILEKHDLWVKGLDGGECANLESANLESANLSGADLSGADLSGANLSCANLYCANLESVKLKSANLESVKLESANLESANLSGAKGVLGQSEFMQKFPVDTKGVLVFKTFNRHYTVPADWNLVAGSFVTETPNPDRATLCGCGVNFATLDWVLRDIGTSTAHVWLCRIRFEDLPGVVVPFNTDGKARCERLELLEELSIEEASVRFKLNP